MADTILRRFEIVQPPVDVRGLVRRMGIALLQLEQAAWSGAVNSNEGAAAIWIRSSDHEVRQRFTVAHELGHLMLHDLGMAFRDDTFSGGPTETQANRFAASLLMPLWMLKPLYSATPVASLLAQKFLVSEHAMNIQIDNLAKAALGQHIV